MGRHCWRATHGTLLRSTWTSVPAGSYSLQRRGARQRWRQHELGDGIGDRHAARRRFPTVNRIKTSGDRRLRAVFSTAAGPIRFARPGRTSGAPAISSISCIVRSPAMSTSRPAWRRLQAVDPWSKAGVMIRETLTAGSRHAFAHPTSEWLSADAARQYVGHLQQHGGRVRRPAARMGSLDSPRQYCSRCIAPLMASPGPSTTQFRSRWPRPSTSASP